MTAVAMTLGSHGIYSQSGLAIATDTIAFATKDLPFVLKFVCQSRFCDCFPT